MNGLANIRSIFAAFRARVRSRARANGCIRGFRLRDLGVGSPGRIAICSAGLCWRTEIFYKLFYDVLNVCIIMMKLTTMVPAAVLET